MTCDKPPYESESFPSGNSFALMYPDRSGFCKRVIVLITFFKDGSSEAGIRIEMGSSLLGGTETTTLAPTCIGLVDRDGDVSAS